MENLAPKVKNVTKLAVDAAGGKLYWTEKTGERTGRIQRVNLDGNPNVQLVKNLTSVPLDITLDAANGKIYLANVWGKVQRLNVDGSNFQPNLINREIVSYGALYQVMLEYRFDSDSVRHTPHISL